MKRISYTILFAITAVTAVLLGCKKESPYYTAENKLQQYDGDALAYLKAQPNTFDSLLKVLDKLPETQSYVVDSTITLFAPTNASFAAALKNFNVQRSIEGKRADLGLDNLDLSQLDTMVCKYISSTKKPTSDFNQFLDGLYVKSIRTNEQMHLQYVKLDASGYMGGGPQSVTYSDTKEGFVRTYWERAETAAVNIETKNAVVYVLSPLHNFGFNEMAIRSQDLH